MRNFAKIFTAIVVAFAAYSCVADATEDLGVQVGNGEGKTTITLSLEESRTQLGEKTGDVYPLYWSAGDQIAVNGTASTALGEEWDGKSSASFTVEGVTLPYSIVYPAPAEAALEEWGKETVEVTDPETGEPVLDPETGEPTTEEVDVLNAVLYPVVFPASQTYVANGIDGASAPMYGYSTKEGEVPTLKHLVGLLQFNVKGEGKVLKNIVVKSERGAIAGTYYVNCEKNLLVVKEGSISNQVSMSFGDGLALGAEATTFYVTVPAGSYGTFVATLYTDTEKMTVKFNSDVLPIAAGYVREFAPFTFVHNDNDTEEEFIIDSEDKLIEFASIAKAFYPRTVARVTKSLDMSEKSWTPIEGFGNFVFDGGSEQGYTIKGLKAPLFGTTSGKIQNVTLEDVDLTSNGQLIMGAIANTLTSGGQAEKASLTNCKAIGTLTISNPEWTPTSSQDADKTVVNYGGLVGRSLGADLVNCTNQVAVTVEQLAVTGNTAKVYPCVAGVAGFIEDATLADGNTAANTFTNVINDAAVSYECVANKEDKNWVARVYVGGVFGSNRGDSLSFPVLTECQNTANGVISIDSNVGGTYNWGGSSCVGGLAGFSYNTKFDNCDNHGAVSANGRLYSLNIGGVAGTGHYCYVSDCDNYGAISLSKESTILATHAGGVMGVCYGGKVETAGMYDCTNNAPVTIAASVDAAYPKTASTQYFYRVGGVVGFLRVNSSGLTNNEAGAVTTSGNHIIFTSNTELIPLIAGCVAYKTTGTSGGDYKNFAPVTVSNHFSYTDNATPEKHPISVAGVVAGGGTNRIENGVNSGNVTFNGTITGGSNLYIGGVFGNAVSNENIGAVKGSNSGVISVVRPEGVTESVTIDGNVFIGGIGGASINDQAVANYTNTGSVFIGSESVANNISITGTLKIGGVYGEYTGGANVSTVQNSGTVTVHKDVTTPKNIYIGGVFGGQYSGGNLSNVTNSGNVNAHCNTTKTSETTSRLYVAGVAILIVKKTATDVANTGNINVTGNIAAVTYVDSKGKTQYRPTHIGGVFAGGASGSVGTFTRVVNGAVAANGKPIADKGKITVSGTIGGRVHMGGIAGFEAYNYRPGKMDNCHNYGKLVFSGTCSNVSYICGLSMSAPAGNNSTNTTNEGDIEISGTLNSTAHISGMFYNSDQASTIFTNCHNNGNITITESAKLKATAYIMGFGYRLTKGTYDNCSNTGNITHNGTQSGGDVHMGGFSGDRFAFTVENSLTNSGNICFGGTYSTTGTVFLGGIGYGYASPTFTNATMVKNTGTISFTGQITNASGKLQMGGLFSCINANITTITGPLVNEGSIEATGSVKTPANAYIGGIAGNALSPITGATANCNVKAIGFPNAGMIMGSVRTDTVKAVDCKVGGNMILSTQTTTEEDANGGDPVQVVEDVLTKLTTDNWFEYIYGDPVTEAVATGDGCSLL